MSNKKLQKAISVFTSLTTILWLSGIAALVPVSVGAVTVVDGDIIRNPDASGLAQFDVYIAKLVGAKKFKRLILSPAAFNSYGHLKWENLKSVDQTTMDSYTTSDLVRELNDTKVYKLTADGDTGTKQWVNMTAADFVAKGYDWDSIYVVNTTDRDAYTTGSDVTVAAPAAEGEVAAGTGSKLTVALAADTPAAATVVSNAARFSYTKINLTASSDGDITVDSLVAQRTGLGNDAAFSSVDLIDVATNLPIDVNSKTLNSEHQATFSTDFVVKAGQTKSITLAGNMGSLTSYSAETPSLSLASITLKGAATVNGTLPITGNPMSTNSSITIGTATVQRGAYTNATSTSIQVGKQDYTFFSFQIQAGSAEKVKFSQIKVYQEGSATLGSDVVNLELLQDGTKIADGVVASSKYANFSFDEITIDKGKTLQYQVRADVEDGSARTIDLGIYRTTDLLVKGVTYGYNITPTYSSTGSSASNPVLSDNQFTISNGTLQVTRSSSVGAENIGVASDQYLGAFTFTVKGETIDISALTLTITSSTGNDVGASALLNVELVAPNGTVVAGPTDPTGSGVTVSWTDTFTLPVGDTVYKVRGDLQTSANWASDDTVYVSFTPSAMTAQGVTTGNSISATPSSSVSGNTQTVKAATLTITRNTLPATGNIIINQKNVNLSSWSFSATDSGENIRITSILFAGQGQAATNTDALTVYAAGKAQSPVNDAISSQPATSTFAFDSPIIITKGTSVTIELHGDKDTVVSNDTENWGLTDDGGASVIAYGVTTGNSVTETLTEDDGPTLTSVANGELTIETVNNPGQSIVLAGTTGNVFSNVRLSAKYEDLRLDQLVVYVADGSYAFNADSGEYRDLTNVAVYDGTSKLAEAAIPSTNLYTFNFNVDLNGDGVIDSKDVIPKGLFKTLVIKADMSTIDPSTDNSPGTNSADLRIGIGGINGIKTTGKASNTTLTTSTYEIYRDSTSSAMVLRSSKPTVTLASADKRDLDGDKINDVASSLTNGSQAIFAFMVTANASGGEVLLYRTTFVFATSGTDMTLTNVLVKDQNGNTIKAAANPTSYDIDGNNEYWQTVTFNNPNFSVDDSTEAISVPAGESRTFRVFGTVSGAGTGENLSTFLVGDTASTSDGVNTQNFAVVTSTRGFTVPTADLTLNMGNFIWSDNYKGASVSGIDGNNATSQAMWYNGHLVPGLENAVSTTPYVIGWSS